MVFHDVGHIGNQYTGLPGKCASGLEDNFEMRITCLESSKQLNKVLNIIILVRHQVTAPQVEPGDLTEEPAKLSLHHLERFLQIVRVILTEVMQMEPGNSFG